MTCNAFKNKSLTCWVILVFCIISFFDAGGQQPGFHFENITGKEGLADLNIIAITQDAQGFIWIGSEDGLTRYDGYNCVVYRHQSNDPYSISDNEIYALCTDGDGTLWIGTPNGLNRYDAKYNRFEKFFHSSTNDNSPAASNIFALAKDHDGNIWIGTYGGGLDRMEKVKDKQGKDSSCYRFSHYKHNDHNSNSIAGNHILSLSVDAHNRIWAGTSNGLSIWDKSTNKFSHLYHKAEDDNSISQNFIYEIFADPDGTMWLCGKGMLDNIRWPYKASKKDIVVTHFLPKLAGKKKLNDWAISDFIIDPDNNAWMATNDQGLIRFRITAGGAINSFAQFKAGTQPSPGLASSIISKFYFDRSGILWIGTGKGVAKYIPSKNRFNEVSLPENVFKPAQHIIMSLLSDKQGRLWMGYDTDTVIVINNDNKNAVFLPLKYQSSSVTGFDQVNVMYQSKAGDIYIGTLVHGLFIIPRSSKNVYDKKNWIHINTSQFPGLPSNNIYAVTEDARGMIWIGTYAGLCMFNPNTRKLNKVYASPGKTILSGYIIRALCADHDNMTWCGTDDGLLLIKNSTVIKRFKNKENDAASLSNNRVTAAFRDHNNQIWIGTKQGLNLYNYKEDNFKHYTTQNALPNDGIRSITEDKNNNLWIGTNNGLFKLNTVTGKFDQYNIEDGLPSAMFESNVVTRDTTGMFYFGTNNGIVSFRPENITPNRYKPPVAITNIKILNKPIESFNDSVLLDKYRTEKKLVLRYNQNFFSFEFAALNYINSSANQYSYMLEGLDPDWNYAGTQRFAGYTAIKPGNYTFKVKASNNDGVWNEIPATVEVIILSPWWQTWWFYVLCAIAVCSIIYVIYRVRLKQVLKLYRLRSSIAKDLHDDVGSALSSIALLSRIAQNGKTNARLQPEEIFSRIGDTSKRMIDLMDDIVWSVNPDNDRFSNMLVRMREYVVEMLEAKNIAFTFKVSPNIDELKLPMQMRKDFFLIFKEAVNNLTKYAEATNAAIIIERNKNNIITTIEDDGRGFNPQIIHSGNGLKNMQERAAALKGKLSIETSSKGTCVTLIVAVT
jgi:ligand-binding sensor domain-containing protein/two-component sensor histidine kinase